jgi:hypothetical protein
MFVHPWTVLGSSWLHGICGFLLAISMVLNLGSVIIRNRLRNGA